jgi:DNA oxidative demethylase
MRALRQQRIAPAGSARRAPTIRAATDNPLISIVKHAATDIMMTAIQITDGVTHWPGFLGRQAQEELVAALRNVVQDAPLFTPIMPRTGKPFSVRMTNCGSLGWVSDIKGYRYQAMHPDTGGNWPQIPEILQVLWKDLSGYPYAAEACLINFYVPQAKMGLHQDRDEAALDAPVVSVSLGDTAVFRIGGTHRSGKTTSFKLQSGDVMSFGGAARLAFHGIDRVIKGTSTLLPQGGRINLTMRRVTKPV